MSSAGRHELRGGIGGRLVSQLRLFMLMREEAKGDAYVASVACLCLPLLLAVILVAGCAPPGRPLEGGHPAVDDRLYFGRSIGGGGSVSDSAWAGFLRDVVTPRFPDGLTSWRAEGQWRGNSGGIVREESFVVELIHDDDPAVDAAIDAIIDSYKELFGQESVLLVRTPARVRF